MTEARDEAAFALLESLPDETLDRLMDLVVAGKPVQAVKLARETAGPGHSLQAAIEAVGLMVSR
ncbi:hypothetical protein SAMN05216553_104482 [Lentzea fradiae]|uniref:Uncharacterized protein n=1 Tax=Lentzea fradiae TaxID=200378 RepID=A0A1G7QJI9_9PSEU|nr:hypothetical protein [Lentzea fradiae]SDF98717.1 hypothetical protein SAMN05216553_104482 [Lentzea fradiae]